MKLLLIPTLILSLLVFSGCGEQPSPDTSHSQNDGHNHSKGSNGEHHDADNHDGHNH